MAVETIDNQLNLSKTTSNNLQVMLNGNCSTFFKKICGSRGFYFHEILTYIFNHVVCFTSTNSEKESWIYMFENK